MPNRLLLRLKPSKVYWLPFFIGQILGVLVIYTTLSFGSIDFGNTNILNQSILLVIPVAGIFWLTMKVTIKGPMSSLFSIIFGMVLFTSWLIRKDGVFELATIVFISTNALENALALMGLVILMTATFDLAYFSQNLITYIVISIIFYQFEPLFTKINGYIYSKVHVFLSGIYTVVIALISVVFIEFLILSLHEFKQPRHSRRI